MITVLLVDDHPMLRQGVAQLIEMEDGLRVTGQVSNGLDAIRVAHALKPDMILLDLNMKGMSGIETLIEMRKQNITANIVVFTVSDNQGDVAAALRAGADGYLLKDCEPEDLLAAIKQAGVGKEVFSPQLAKVMALALREENASKQQSPLTPRELASLKLVAQGKTNKDIARELTITEATVKVHIKNLLKKLSLRSRVEAALWAVENHVN